LAAPTGLGFAERNKSGAFDELDQINVFYQILIVYF
jgi:hypothetical protein